ncbi:alpha/beta fold hydrolase [Kitasatospora kifunensis]|uniref:Pimeloyl-ACP methyl ester carboxylesterase n=1 Tax=Kitasatospora kifunensis TaxID=58351 RepID=A0A7W7VV50_KITKI|nr:alpha/beta hydrolase [Kitasatospora kifunensis]MBB4923518.1 pimeloyl-ACP methyl ester carboxylesterase [Kitasatospora kifunensis]
MTDLAVRDSGMGVGTPLLLLHAFPLHAGMWRAQLDGALGEARVLAPDLPGFGASPEPAGEPALDTWADAVARLMDAVGLERAVIGGLSMGGYLAMAFARRHGDRLAGLLLADTKASADAPGALANRERIAAAVLARQSVALLLEEKTEDALLGSESTPELVAEVRALIGAANPVGVAWAQRAMAARPDSFETLAQLTVPAAVVVGEHDVLTPLADAEAMASALPDAELTVIPGVGHLSALEAPAAFNAAVTALLRRVA